jgi:hypothetical protein
MEVFKNNLLLLEFFEDRKYLKVKRFDNLMTQDDWKGSVYKWAEIIIKYKPVYQVVDERSFNFIITPDLQKWLNDNLVQIAYVNGMKKVAMIINSDIFIQTSVKQSLEEKHATLLDIQYFHTIMEAENWLFNLE